MNLDFHYYGTYAAAHLAGFSQEECETIAYAAQYVDESDSSHIDYDELKALGINACPTINSPADMLKESINISKYWSDSDMAMMQSIWMPFHFLPGNIDNHVEYTGNRLNTSKMDWGYGRDDAARFRMLCTPSSDLAREMIIDTVNAYRGAVSHRLTLAGMRCHILADTYAHCNFIGSPQWYINSVSGDVDECIGTVKNTLNIGINRHSDDTVESPITGKYFTVPWRGNRHSVTYMGHGVLGHIPDYGYLSYIYHQHWSNTPIEKDNMSLFLRAFTDMTYSLFCIKNGHTYDPRRWLIDDSWTGALPEERVGTDGWDAIVNGLKAVFATRAIDQSAAWIAFLKNSLSIPDTPDTPAIPAFNKNKWVVEFQAAADIDKKKGTSYYHFNLCSELQVKFVERYLNANGLTMKTNIFDLPSSSFSISAMRSRKSGSLIDGLLAVGKALIVNGAPYVADTIPGIQSICIVKNKGKTDYQFDIAIIGKCPKELWWTKLKFTIETGEVHTITLVDGVVSNHSLGYSSDNPTITQISWE